MIDRPLRQTTYFIRHNPVMLLSLGAVIFLIIISFYSLHTIYQSSQRSISNHLQTSLETSVNQLSSWEQQQKRTVEVIKDSSNGTRLIQQVFRTRKDTATQAAIAALEAWIYPIITPLGFQGYSILDRDYRVISTSTRHYMGQTIRIPEVTDVLTRSLKNTSAISQPLVVEDLVDGPEGKLASGIIIQLVCTTYYDGKRHLGYFCLRTNPQNRFFPIFYAGRTGSTGEVYAIDSTGRILTPSRFPEYENISQQNAQHTRREKDIFTLNKDIAAGEEFDGRSRLNPLAERIVNKGLQKVLFDYRGYRGEKVIGVGRWLDDLNMGVIVEQGSAEAFKSYEFSRRSVFILLFSALAALLVLTVSAVAHRINMSKRERIFRSMLDNIPLPIYLTSQNGKIEVANPVLCKLLMLEDKDIVDKWPDEIPIPDYLKVLFSEKINKEVRSRFVEDEMLEIQTRDEGAKYYRVLRFPVKGETSEIVQEAHYIATILVDVTERIVASDKLAEINVKLERLVDERTRELMIAKDRAEEASNAKAEFLANVSHEIRTPLNAIIGLAHVALAATRDKQVQTYLEKMRGSGQHLLRVINDILNFSRLEAGKLELDSSNFLLEDLVDNVVDMVWDRAHSKGVEIQVHISPGIPHTFKGDPLRLGQILINFMANAVKFTEQGTIEFNINLKSDIEGFATIEFEVKDTGIGIPREKLATLFQPFRQIDSSSTRRFEGSGLGLAISKDLADLMGGIIEVESEHNVGSAFKLLVTLEDVSETDVFVSSIKADNVFSEKAKRINANILLVEDNRLNQEVAEALLKMSGCNITTVSSGVQAIEVMKHDSESIDVILMDIQMPIMDGVKATQEIRKLDKCEYIPIIAMTANVLSGDREKYLNSGMDDYIAKPIDPEQLVNTLQKWVNEEKVEKAKDYELDLMLDPPASAPKKRDKRTDTVSEKKSHMGFVDGAATDATDAAAGASGRTPAEESIVSRDTNVMESASASLGASHETDNTTLAATSSSHSNAESASRPSHRSRKNTQDVSQNVLPFLVLKNEGVDIDTALHNVMGNSKLYSRLLVRFVQERADFSQQMQEFLAQDKLDMVLNEVHALGSLAGTLGLYPLMNIARTVEQQLKDDALDKSCLAQLFKQLENDLTMVHAWMFLSGEAMEDSSV
ncbi:Autoinducer 2 sensor kinase/phosphatase LuxQ [Thalassocella blandensis]|nr:Autoinducer 2 sensor kinase/phosphatase LuxQ [Thalassocella blandensis]